MTRRSHRLAAVDVGAQVFKLETLGLVGGSCLCRLGSWPLLLTIAVVRNFRPRRSKARSHQVETQKIGLPWRIRLMGPTDMLTSLKISKTQAFMRKLHPFFRNHRGLTRSPRCRRLVMSLDLRFSQV